MSQRFQSVVDDDGDDLTIPSRGAPDTEILAYTNHIRSRGMAFLKAQPAYPDIQKGRELVHGLGTYEEAIPDKLSHVRIPRIKRQLRELVATLSNIRPTSDYVSSNPTKYEGQANVLNKLQKSWYFGEKVDRSIRQALQYAAAEGTGYLHITWEKPLRAKTGRIKLTPLGAMGYIPFQQSLNNKIQDAETGIICTEIPLQRARRLYRKPHLQATNSTATNLIGSVVDSIVNVATSVYLRVAGTNRRKGSQSNTPTVDIYHCYIKDDSLNESGAPIKMGPHKASGEPDSNFSYTVPYMGQPLPTGFRTLKKADDGQPFVDPVTLEEIYEDEMREATASDCLIYPDLRLIICSPDDLIYDGPSMWWHGKIPVVQFRFDDWPWNFLGFSLVRDTWRLEESINSRKRAVDDSTNAQLNPALMYDSRMSEQFDENFTPRIPGGRIVKPPALMTDKPLEPVLPANFYQVSPTIDAEIVADEQRLDFLMGINGMDAIMRLKQLPQSDSLDKVLSASSAIIEDLGRNMESSVCELGEMFKALAFQYCTTEMRMQLLGDDGVTVEDFDFDPGNMIPSHLPGEDTQKPSRATKAERARAHIDSFQFIVVPNSITQITALTRKMIAIQLWRDPTFPKDPWSLAEDLDIPNMGPVPPDCANRIDRFKAWMTLLANLQKEVSGGEGQDPMALIQQMLGGKMPEGRPPSGGKPPHFEKNGQTIAES